MEWKGIAIGVTFLLGMVISAVIVVGITMDHPQSGDVAPLGSAATTDTSSASVADGSSGSTEPYAPYIEIVTKGPEERTVKKMYTPTPTPTPVQYNVIQLFAPVETVGVPSFSPGPNSEFGDITQPVYIEPSYLDSDGDGLLDTNENNGNSANGNYQTNPYDWDTDHDGLSDDYECLDIGLYDTDPTNSDCDDDGLLDGMEFPGTRTQTEMVSLTAMNWT